MTWFAPSIGRSIILNLCLNSMMSYPLQVTNDKTKSLLDLSILMMSSYIGFCDEFGCQLACEPHIPGASTCNEMHHPWSLSHGGVACNTRDNILIPPSEVPSHSRHIHYVFKSHWWTAWVLCRIGVAGKWTASMQVTDSPICEAGFSSRLVFSLHQCLFYQGSICVKKKNITKMNFLWVRAVTKPEIPQTRAIPLPITSWFPNKIMIPDLFFHFHCVFFT